MEWFLLALAGLILGIAKTSFGGLASIAVALFALAMPTKESTATVVLLLICGEIVAVLRFGRNADWRLLVRLLPAVIPGLLLGAAFMNVVDDDTLRRSIGAVLFVCLVVQLALTRQGKTPESGETVKRSRALSLLAGAAAGFATMAANAAGPVMVLYLQLARVDKLRFLGTFAWFFLVVDLAKTPLTAGLGLFTVRALHTAAVLIPVVLVGTAIGIAIVGRVGQKTFDLVTLAMSGLAALALVVL